MNKEDLGVSVFTIVSSITTFLIGEQDLAIKILITMMIFDYITGVAKAYILSKLSSQYGFKGILKKTLILLVVSLTVLMDRLLGTDDLLRTMVCYWYIAVEGISVTENLAQSGVPLPKFLVDRLVQLKEQGEQDVNNKITHK
jgi:toxin secretion/phage lysis holin